MRRFAFILTFLFIAPAIAGGEINADNLDGPYLLESPFQVGVTAKVEILDQGRYSFTELGKTYSLICNGEYVLIKGLFVGHAECLNGLFFTHILNFQGLKLDDLKEGAMTQFYSSAWELSEPIPVKLSRPRGY